MKKEIKKLKWKRGDCVAKFQFLNLGGDDKLVGGKLKEIIDKINEIIDYSNEKPKDPIKE